MTGLHFENSRKILPGNRINSIYAGMLGNYERQKIKNE